MGAGFSDVGELLKCIGSCESRRLNRICNVDTEDKRAVVGEKETTKQGLSPLKRKLGEKKGAKEKV